MKAERQKSKSLVPLPDGTEVSAYEGSENWDHRRWAWEFLRRNDDFRAACREWQELDSDGRKLRAVEIAAKFLLRKFRHCDEQITDGDLIAFHAQKVSPLSSTAIEWRMPLENYQVAIVFDLRPSLYAKNAAKVQLQKAKKTLDNRLKELKVLTDFKNKSVATTVKQDVYLRRLRVLDARRAQFTWEQIANHVKTDADRNIDIRDRAERLRKDHKAALELVNFGYLRVLTSVAIK